MVAMPQGMNIPERKVVLLAELFEPVVCSIVVHGVSVSRCEQPVALEPRAHMTYSSS